MSQPSNYVEYTIAMRCLLLLREHCLDESRTAATLRDLMDELSVDFTSEQIAALHGMCLPDDLTH